MMNKPASSVEQNAVERFIEFYNSFQIDEMGDLLDG